MLFKLGSSFLPTSLTIQPKLLFQLYDVPINFAAVGTKMTLSGSIYLGGPDLKLPRLHSDLTLQQYCGLAYLGVWVDNGDGIFSLLLC